MQVWMLALVAVICVPLVLAVLITVYKRQEAGVTFRGSLSTTVEYTVRTIFMQGEPVRNPPSISSNGPLSCPSYLWTEGAAI